MTGVRRAPPAGRGLRKKSGFALLAVIWGTGVISLLVVAFMTGGRLRLQTAHNIASATQAGYAAEGVINMAAMTLLAERDTAAAQAQPPVYDGAPRYCVFDGVAVALAIEDEGGKVDINAAPQQLLQAMLTGVGVEARAADQIAGAIVAFRTPPGEDLSQGWMKQQASDKPLAPKKAPFETVMELDQVSGIDSALFREIIPLVTIHSRSAGVDAQVAPPALFAALAGYPPQDVQALSASPFPNTLNRKDARFPANFRQTAERGAFLIHAEALLATGQTAAKDAVLDLRSGPSGQLAIKELRRGRSKYVGALRDMIANNGMGVPDC